MHNENIYSQIFWALPDYYVVVDVSPDYRIIDATNSYLTLGEKERDVIGKPIFEVFPDSQDLQAPY